MDKIRPFSQNSATENNELVVNNQSATSSNGYDSTSFISAEQVSQLQHVYNQSSLTPITPRIISSHSPSIHVTPQRVQNGRSDGIRQVFNNRRQTRPRQARTRNNIQNSRQQIRRIRTNPSQNINIGNNLTQPQHQTQQQTAAVDSTFTNLIEAQDFNEIFPKKFYIFGGKDMFSNYDFNGF